MIIMSAIIFSKETADVIIMSMQLFTLGCREIGNVRRKMNILLCDSRLQDALQGPQLSTSYPRGGEYTIAHASCPATQTR